MKKPKVNSNAKYMRPTDVTEYLGISRSTLYAWIGDGYFPRPLKIGPRATLFHVAEIEAFLANCPRTIPTDADE